MTSIQYSKGQVVLIQMCRTGSLRRPAVIIDLAGDISNQVLTVVPVTTSEVTGTTESKELLLNAKDFVSTNIRHEVYVDCSIVAEVSVADVVGVVGQLSTTTLRKITSLIE